MQNIKHLPALAELQALEAQYSAEQWLEISALMRPLVLLQEWPDIGLHQLSGIYVPPHQRWLIYQMHRGAGSNVVVASRGTAKSSTVCVLYAVYCASVFAKKTGIILAATGFRGGQMILLDAARFLAGSWDSQMQEVPFLRASMSREGDGLNKSQSFWQVPFHSGSQLFALPTKTPEDLRGWRCHWLFLDEANFFDIDIKKVVEPFLNVGGDMRHGGAYAEENSIFYTSTIDYSWRPFLEQVRVAKEGAARDYKALTLMYADDWRAVRKLEKEGLHEHTYTQFDYTDMLIRRRIKTRDGRTMQVTWPDPNIPLTFDPRGIPFLDRDAEGRIQKRGEPVAYYKTYSIQKQMLERSLYDGSVDEASWKSEQRNVVDTAIGDVYGWDLMDRVTCRGTHCVLEYADCTPEWKKKYEDSVRDYLPPVLWSSKDPCVLGVDYAPINDFTAFVVYRLGPLAEGVFNPLTHHGKTKWSNVIWAEQHRRMTHQQAAEKIRELMARYHLIWFHDPQVVDHWDACRAIGLDMKGGGHAIRDEVARFSQEILQPGETRLYDPLDKDERILHFGRDARALPLLDGIHPSDQMNDKLVEFTKGQMENQLLYIATYLDESERPDRNRALDVGYQGVKILGHQLRKIRQQPTKNWRSFYMDGNTEKEKNKKDMFSAFLYAGKQMRAHIIRQSQIDNTPPPMGARVLKVGGRRGQYTGRAHGAKG
jgi:hypothetical protein